MLANLLYALFQWALLLIVARASGPDSLGKFTLALAVCAPVFMATNMRLRFIQSADFSQRWQFADFLRVRLGSAVIGFAVCGLVSLAWNQDTDMQLVLMAVALFKVMESLQDICLGAYQSRSQMHLSVLSNLAAGLLTACSFAVIYAYTESLLWASIALAFSRVLGLVSVDVPLVLRAIGQGRAPEDRASARVADRREWVAIVARAWPLGIVAALDSLNAGIPRYFLSWGAGNAELGLYAVMVHVSFVGFVMVNSVGQSMSPSLARRFGGGDRAGFLRDSRSLFLAAAVVGILGIAAVSMLGDTLVRLLYGDTFVVSNRDFAAVMLGGMLSYVSLAAVFVLTAAQMLRVQAWLYATNFVAIVVFSALLVPRWGVSGAAGALVAANLMQLIASTVVLRKVFR